LLQVPLTQHTVTINDSVDPPPILTLSVDQQSATEGDSNLPLEVRLSEASGIDIVVPLNTAGSVGDGVDLDLSTPQIVIPAGHLSAFATWSVIDDSIYESVEEVTLSLGQPTHGTLGAETTQSIQIFDNDDPPAISFLDGPTEVDESSQALTFKVGLAHSSALTVTANLLFEGTATYASDFSVNLTSIIIPATQTEVEVIVNLIDDSLVESDEILTITLSQITHATLSSPSTITTLINDNDSLPSVQFVSSQQARNEDSGVASVAIEISHPAALDVIVPIDLAGDATLDTDYTLIQNPIVIPAGATSAIIQLLLINDPIHEMSESVHLSIGEPINGIRGELTSHHFTILDIGDPIPTLSFAQPNSFTLENDQTTLVFIQLSSQADDEISVPISVGGSATSGSDYEIFDFTAVIPAGLTSVGFELQIRDDDRYEATETVTLMLGVGSGASVEGLSEHTLTIVDNDAPPIVEFETTSTTITEGIGSTLISVRTSEPAGIDLEIPYLYGGTAQENADYEISSAPLIVPAEQTHGQIEVTILNDELFETTETIAIELLPPDIASLGEETSHSVTILDDEEIPELTISAPTLMVSESDQLVTLTIHQSVPTIEDVTVSWLAQGTAIDGVDYALAPNPAVIHAGTTTANLSLVLINDLINEGEESLTVTISAPAGTTLGVQKSVTLTLMDDGDPIPTVEFIEPQRSASEATGSIDVLLQLSAVSGLPIEIPFQLSGIATLGSDYFISSDSVMIPPGQQTGAIAVFLIDDLIDEPAEDLTLTLGSPTNAELLSQDQYELLILDDDDLPLVSFDSAGTTTVESQGEVVVSISLHLPSGSDVTIPYTISGSASPDLDFLPTSSSVTIPAGSTDGELTFDLLDDHLYEDTEAIQITLGSPAGAQTGPLNSHLVTILDDDPFPTISFESASSIVSEGTLSLPISVELSVPSSQDVLVSLTTSGTADPVSDYTVLTNHLVIPAGSTTKQVMVAIHEDPLDEPEEEFSLSLSAVIGANLGLLLTHEVTITDNDDPVLVSVSIPHPLISESSASFEIPVQLSEISGFDVLLTWSAGGDATIGVDYVVDPESLLIPAGSLSGVISLEVADDSLNELNESIILTFEVLSGGTLTNSSPITITLVDDDLAPSVQFSNTSNTLSESSGTTLIPVILSQVSGQDIFVDVVASGSASANSDYEIASASVHIPRDHDTGFLAVELIDDVLMESAEEVTFSLLLPSNATLGQNRDHTLTILDDDIFPSVQFASTDQSVLENSPTAQIEMTLSEPSSSAITVPYTVHGTATSSEDYQPLNGSIEFGAGEISQTLQVSLLDDVLVEGNESLIILLGTPTNAVLGNSTEHVMTIQDDELPPTLQFVSVSSSISEGEPPTVVTLELSHSSTLEVTAEIVLSGSAQPVTDFTVIPLQFTIPAGQLSGTLELSVQDDSHYEVTEFATLTLGVVNNATIDQNAVHQIEILDDDPIPTVLISMTEISVPEATPTVQIPITLAGTSSLPITLPFVTSGTAQEGIDFTPPTAPLIIPPEASVATIELELLDDSINDGDQLLLIELSPPTNANLGVDDQITLTILDDDTAIAVSFTQENQTITEGAQDLSVEVQLSTPSEVDLLIQFSASGSATEGEDFTLSTHSLTIPAGSLSGVITLSAIADFLDEALEQITLTILPPPGTNLGSIPTQQVSILDDDPEPTIEFVAASTEVSEGAGTISIAIALSEPSGQSISVSSVLSGTATIVEDYTLTPALVELQPGATSATFDVIVEQDLIHELPETITLSLQNPIAATLGSLNTHTVTIEDDDAAPLIRFSSATSTISEGEGTVFIGVELSAPSEVNTTVELAFSGSASSGTDYLAPASTLFIPAEQTDATIELTLQDDLVHESTETIQISLSLPSGATLGEPANHTLSIVDNESIPTLTLDSLPPSILESAEPLDIGVTLSHTTSSSVSVSFSFGGTATQGSDYSISATSITIPPESVSGNLTLELTDDILSEDLEVIEIQMTEVVGAQLGSPQSATIDLLDDEGAPVVFFELAGSSASEGELAHTVKLIMSHPVATAVTVPIQLMGSATDLVDLTVTPIPATFAPGQTESILTVALLEDDLDEPEETLLIEIEQPIGANIGNPSLHSLTVTDVDSPPTIEFSASATTIEEASGIGSVLVSLSAASAFDVTVPIEVGGTADPESDYSVPSSVTISAGENSAEVLVMVSDDELHEGDESLLLTLGTPINATPGPQQSLSLTILDNDPTPGVFFTSGSQSAVEGGAPLQITLSLSEVSGLETVIDVALSGTATTPADYSIDSTQLTIPASSISGSLTLNIAEDNTFEGSEELVITIVNVVGGTPTSPSTHVVTIEDSGSQPVVSFLGSNSEISEALGSIQVPVQLSNRTDFEVTVSFEVLASSTASNAIDFDIAPSPLVFSPGEMEKSISISILDDAAVENSETIDLQVLNPINASLGTPTQHTVTILDDDDAPCDLVYSQADVVYPPGVQITPNLPSVFCGVPTSWSIQPQLPNGLNLDESSGVIFGTPVDRSARTEHTIIASNANGITTTTVNIAIDFVFYYTGTSEPALYDPVTGNLVTPLNSIPVSLFFREDPNNFSTPNTFHETKGLSASIQHDPLQLTAVQVEIGVDFAALDSGIGPEFFGPLIGANVVTIGVVYSLDLLQPVTVIADVEREIASIRYTPVPDLLIGDTDGVTLTLPWGHPLGPLGIQNEVVIDGATGVTPLTTDPTIELIAQ